ncbi:hypothetical protein LUZ61_017406 [Rhynchospora tenuis]|uniref:RING-type E3 ubiquitin transferase n=1 Tax=Rhynchospora tenuis TaxID=198213 RepID=A0AAD5Z7A4_9POAL|nr:hypothetical protein LUZ61_017406 [Rhynchospora tenuis]
MGHGISCARSSDELEFFRALQSGDLDAVQAALSVNRDLVHRCTPYGRVSPLHIVSANGHLELLSMLLDQSVNPDLLNRHKQTPLMLAAMNGKIECVNKLLEAGANILMFDSLNGRTCLHHAAYYGHTDCLKAILSAAQSSPVAHSWGFARYVNLKDDNGATPLHLASRQGRAVSVHILLDNGAIVSSPTGSYGFPGSTPLHLAARGGWVDCVRELLAWGADRLHRDSAGRIPYAIALKRNHGACAALLNPSSAEPLVWPSPLKFISELNADAKELLEAALMEANLEREKKILRGAKFSCPSPSLSEDGSDDNISEGSEGELCSICFERACTIEVHDCAHQMCAPCTLSLCCHSKPNPSTLCLTSPTCPFCRSTISKLVVAKQKSTSEIITDESEKIISPRPSVRRLKSRSRNLSEGGGSSSFKGISSAVGSLSKMGRGSGRIADSADMEDKLDHMLCT